jgi:5-methylthioribose kinase
MLVFEDQRHHLVCMDAVPEPHENWKTRLLAGRLEFGHTQAFGSLVGRIHGEARRHVAEVSGRLRGPLY